MIAQMACPKRKFEPTSTAELKEKEDVVVMFEAVGWMSFEKFEGHSEELARDFVGGFVSNSVRLLRRTVPINAQVISIISNIPVEGTNLYTR